MVRPESRCAFHLLEQGSEDLHRSFGQVARNLAEAPLTLTELADRLGTSSPGALTIVQQMADAGQLERLFDPDDARANHLRLTRRGRAALAAARAFHARFERELASRLGPRKLQALRDVLADVVDHHEAGGGAQVALRPM